MSALKVAAMALVALGVAALTSGKASAAETDGTTQAMRLNRTWSFDRKSVWVSDGCRAEFALNTRQEAGSSR
jgi:hypothetical protein